MNIFSCAPTLDRAINIIDTKHFKMRYYQKKIPIWLKLADLIWPFNWHVNINWFILILLSIFLCLLFSALVHFRFIHLVCHLLFRVLFASSFSLLPKSTPISFSSPHQPLHLFAFRAEFSRSTPEVSFAPIRAESSHQVRGIFLRRLLGRVQPIVSGVSSFVAFRAFAWDPWDQGPKTRLVIM